MHGILLIDKPPDVGSAEVVRRVKKFVKPAKVGHLGTLDPFATGLLPILIGEATKIAQFLEHDDKYYAGIIALGAETDTLDRSGEVVRRAAVPALDAARLDEITAGFIGAFEQVPPVYSAIKRAGVPLYKLARRGEQPEPAPPRTVHVKRLELTIEGADRLRFSLQCATGMYVRALARDIGAALGSVAHLAELRRLGTAGFSVDQATPMDEALTILAERRIPPLVGLSEALVQMARVEVDRATQRRVRNGDASALLEVVRMGQGTVKVLCDGALVAIAEIGAGRSINLLRVFGGSE
ncbi:MAG TPA: tRNA pseudouridine(55) synthase TruB [Candidatus Binataceae bacterium]|nr:tRNA pseudouridine(55) synthase TruB [Candidatus Binataceae bacterium]